MELTLRGYDLERISSDRITEIVTFVSVRSPDPDNLHLIVAGDFETAVKDTVTDPEYAARYTAGRSFHRAVAKTIPLGDGKTALILDAATIVADMDVERLLSHEVLHLVVQASGEETSDIRSRVELPYFEGLFAAIAGIAVGEFRVERALCEQGYWTDVSYRDDLRSTLSSFAAEMRRIYRDRAAGGSVQEMSDQVLGTLSQLCTHMAYVAALDFGDARSDQTLRGLAGAALWDRWIGTVWEEYRAELELIPSAESRVERALLDSHALALAKLCRTWLGHVGFTVTDFPEGGGYIDIIRRDF